MFNRDTLLNELRTNVIEVNFTKKDGNKRILKCTLRPDLLPSTYVGEDVENEKNFHRTNPDVIAAWDIENNGWRSFRIDSVIYAQDISEKYV
jgi:WYL_2, Sm-like SH3 beta-barrel fold